MSSLGYSKNIVRANVHLPGIKFERKIEFLRGQTWKNKSPSLQNLLPSPPPGWVPLFSRKIQIPRAAAAAASASGRALQP